MTSPPTCQRTERLVLRLIDALYFQTLIITSIIVIITVFDKS